MSGATTAEDLRQQTTARVLRSLREDGPASRVQLAERTGLSKATVGVIVTRLAGLGIVADLAETDAGVPEAPAGRGRPARPVALRPGHRGLGLEVNVDYVAAGLVDLAGSVGVREVRALGDGDRVQALLALLEEVLPQLGDDVLAGVVVAVPGLVDAGGDRLVWAPNLAVTGDEVLAGLRRRLGPEVALHLDNDANCAAYGEVRHGAAHGAAHAVYLTGTVGIGAGIVADGQVLRGAAGNAGEIGHVPLGRPGARCGCGRSGCWETAVGLAAMLELTGAATHGDPVSTAEAVAARAAHDPDVRRGLGRLAEDLARGLAVLVSVTDPEVVVLGGYLGALGEALLGPATEHLDRLLPSPSQRRPTLIAGSLGVESAALGAAELALDPLLAGAVPITLGSPVRST